MNVEISKYFEMKFLWQQKRIMDESGKIKEIYNQPERLSEKARKGCDSPNTPTKGSESSRND